MDCHKECWCQKLKRKESNMSDYHDIPNIVIEVEALKKKVDVLSEFMNKRMSKEHELENKLGQISTALEYVIKENTLHIKSFEKRISSFEMVIQAQRTMNEHILGLIISKKCQCQK